MKNLTPYLMFNGNCEEAINFYQTCFDGEIGYIGTYADAPMEVSESQKGKIMHVEFKFWGGTILASDDLDNADYTTKPENTNIHLSLGFEDEAEMEKVYNLLGQGGQRTMEIKEQFWGSKFGMLTDKFGIKWMFSSQHKDK